MNLLFDTSPEEVPDVKKKAGKRAVSTAEPQPAPEPMFLPAHRELRIIGRIDHTYTCERSRCGAQCHDIIGEQGAEWLLECCFCGQWQWVPAVEGILDTGKEVFTFRDGRFEGLSIHEASLQPHGRKYIEWAAASHKRDAVKIACRSWLDQFKVDA